VVLQATLIPVKIYQQHEPDMEEALELIVKNIRENPGRAERSVILITEGWGRTTYAEARGDTVYQDLWEKNIRDVFNLGVPLVLAAGNNLAPRGENRKTIDTRPQVYQDQSTPIINVGAADFDGKRVDMSRYNDQPMIYAPGKNVRSLTKSGFSQVADVTGTSYGRFTFLSSLSLVKQALTRS
jgi:hypothetical protein